MLSKFTVVDIDYVQMKRKKIQIIFVFEALLKPFFFLFTNLLGILAVKLLSNLKKWPVGTQLAGSRRIYFYCPWLLRIYLENNKLTKMGRGTYFPIKCKHLTAHIMRANNKFPIP